MVKQHKENVPCPKCSRNVTRPQNLRWHLIFTHDLRPSDADAIMNSESELIGDTILDTKAFTGDNSKEEVTDGKDKSSRWEDYWGIG